MTAPTTRGSLNPAKITNLNTEEIVYFMFNPFEFTISKTNSWANRPVTGINLPLVSFTNGGAQSLTLNLYFDTTRSPGDVRAFTAPLWNMMMIDPDTIDTNTGKGQPPQVAFEWGGLYFKAIITTMSENYVLFNAEGIPLRSKVTITLQQFIDETDLPPQIQDQLANEQAQSTQQMQEGERLDNVASQNGQQPGSYREIAEQNNIDNPQRVPNGTQLRV
ncbi:MAG: hypothetical protein IPK52_07555 [Chloroflexi bacterium]|nr:hypothetical protein [Chloroflexota bacterium]